MTNLAVGCYGKLPLHGDFIRHNHGAPELGVLDRWVQEGIVSARSTLGNAFDDAFDRAPASRFVYNSMATGRIVAGIILPGCDKVGRQYPFIIYTAAPSQLFGGEFTLVPGIFHDFFERARVISADWIGKDLRTFISRVDSLSFSIDLHDCAQRFSQALAQRTTEGLWSEVFGSYQDVRKYLLVQNLVDGVKPGITPRYALRFPNSPDPVNVTFWLELANKLSNRRVLPTLTMWSWLKDEASPMVSILMDDLQPKYFMPLMQPDSQAPVVLNIGMQGLGDDGKLRTAKSRFGALLDQPNLTIREFLSRVSR